MKKLISVITAAAAVAAISATAGAYSINKDLGFGWSTSATIGAEEFANRHNSHHHLQRKREPRRHGRSELLVHQAHGERRRLAFHQHT